MYHYKSASQLRLGRIFSSSRDLVDASGTQQHPTQGGEVVVQLPGHRPHGTWDSAVVERGR
jgi:hypothetical protein